MLLVIYHCLGMPHEKKVQLIRSLNIIKVIEGVEAHRKSNLFAKSVAGLIGGIMSELIIVHEEIRVADLIQETVEISFNFLQHSDPEVVIEILEVSFSILMPEKNTGSKKMTSPPPLPVVHST